MLRLIWSLTSRSPWQICLYSQQTIHQVTWIRNSCTQSSRFPLLAPHTPRLSTIRHKSTSKDNPYPPLNEDELEEKFIHGSGPGGQNINKLSNCVMLTHIPTGEVIKCHEHRQLSKNRSVARLRMQERLDWFYNRENSLKQQQKREGSKRKQLKKNRTNEKLAKLKAFKEREGLD